MVYASKIEGKMIVKYLRNANLIYLNLKTVIDNERVFGCPMVEECGHFMRCN